MTWPYYYLIPLLGALITYFPLESPFLEGICEYVLDGDTLRVAGQTVRLAHIDAPEWEQRSRWGVPVGEQSAQFLADLVLHRKIKVVRSGQDLYGRWPGRVWLGERDINLEMVLQGHAFAFSWRRKPPGIFVSAQAVAKAKGYGIWRYQKVQFPWRYRRQRKNALK